MAKGDIELGIWKQIVEVQQHFNDLELRIRNYALIVTGAFIGLGGYAIKDGGFVSIFGFTVSVAGLVVFAAIFPLFAFYFMDRLWYHRLLEGSVAAGIAAEIELTNAGYKVALGTEIKNASPFKLWLFGWSIRSKHKMDMFYAIILLSLMLVSGVLGFGIKRIPPVAAAPAVTEVQPKIVRPCPIAATTTKTGLCSAK